MDLKNKKAFRLAAYIAQWPVLISFAGGLVFVGAFCDSGIACDNFYKIYGPMLGIILSWAIFPIAIFVITGQIILSRSKHVFFPIDAAFFLIAPVLWIISLVVPLLWVTQVAFWCLMLGFAAESILLAYVFCLKIYKIEPVDTKEERKEYGEPLKNHLWSSPEITPFLGAVISGDITLVQTALQKYPEHLNTAYANNGNTPLHVAALNGYTDIVRLLLAQPGIDTTRSNNAGQTALDLAREKGFEEIALLLENR